MSDNLFKAMLNINGNLQIDLPQAGCSIPASIIFAEETEKKVLNLLLEKYGKRVRIEL